MPLLSRELSLPTDSFLLLGNFMYQKILAIGIVTAMLASCSSLPPLGALEKGGFVTSALTHLFKSESKRQKEIAASARRADLSKLNFEELNTIKLGSGEQLVAVFVDPLNTHSMDLVEKLKEIDGKHPERYTFNLVVVPALGDESLRMAKALFCAKDKTYALDALLAEELLNLERDETCKTSDYDLTLLIADGLGIQGVPFLIAPDGRFHTGLPEDVAVWLDDSKN